MNPPRDYYLPNRQLVSQADSALIESANVPRSKFTGAWTHKTTFDAGFLVPFLVDDILPGDHMTYRVSTYIRMSTPLFPIFDNQRVDTFFFFVPNRLLWTKWVNMMGEQNNPGESIAFTVPQIILTDAATTYITGEIYDHMGLPNPAQMEPGGSIPISALPLRAYNRIYHEWFRDQNIMDAPGVNNALITGDANDDPNEYRLLRRCKSHDYFTSALPFPQKFTSPGIPISGSAAVTGLGIADVNPTAGPLNIIQTGGAATYQNYWSSAAQAFYIDADAAGAAALPNIFASFSSAFIAINEFREAFLVQQLLERDARGGTRYVELIRSHFGVVNPDFRLQRPEYIGGGQTSMQITPIAQTAPTDDTVVGALGAAGTAAGQHTASYAATEHGWIIGLINVRTELSYQQGVHRMWSRKTRLEHYVPSLAQLGEQAILRKELYMLGDGGDTDEFIFGYQERWHEYRQRTSEVTGMFRSGIAGTLDAWHLAQYFDGVGGVPPLLIEAFMLDNPPMERVLAAGALAEGQHYLADILIQRTAVRPLPTYGTPATLGRF